MFTKDAEKKSSPINKVVFFASFIICLGVFIYSGYKFSGIMIEYYKGHNTYSKISKLYANSGTGYGYTGSTFTNSFFSINIPQFNEDNDEKDENGIFKKYYGLLGINNDTVGWIRIPNTNINLPVVQAKDNEFYLDKDFNKNKSTFGCIFMDYENDIKKKDQNTILYGHNMKDTDMFNNLIFFLKEDFFKSNRKIYFDTLYEKHEWEVFTVYVTDTKFDYLIENFPDPKTYLSFLSTVKGKSHFGSDAKFTQDDRILTLSTCAYDFEDARLVIQAKLIK